MPTDAAPAAFETRNRIALFGWGFMAVWLAMLGAFTWILARDGPHPGQAAWLQQVALVLFWLVGLPAAAHLFAQPCTRLRVTPDGAVTLDRRSLFARETERFAPGGIHAVMVRADTDSDGDPYWRTLLVAADGRERVIAEGHDEAAQAALAGRLRRALGLPEAPAPRPPHPVAPQPPPGWPNPPPPA
jgi:hypothetical protein